MPEFSWIVFTFKVSTIASTSVPVLVSCLVCLSSRVIVDLWGVSSFSVILLITMIVSSDFAICLRCLWREVTSFWIMVSVVELRAVISVAVLVCFLR